MRHWQDKLLANALIVSEVLVSARCKIARTSETGHWLFQTRFKTAKALEAVCALTYDDTNKGSHCDVQ
jgi:hypothetical protein